MGGQLGPMDYAYNNPEFDRAIPLGSMQKNTHGGDWGRGEMLAAHNIQPVAPVAAVVPLAVFGLTVKLGTTERNGFLGRIWT